MARGKRSTREEPLQLQPHSTAPAQSVATAYRFTVDYLCNVRHLPLRKYAAGAIVSNALTIKLLLEAGAPIEAV